MDTCDNCGNEAELFHNEVTGLSFCEDCDSEYTQEAHRFPDFESDTDEVEAEGFHAELRQIIEQAEGTDLEALVPQAQALLALPEESIAALVSAAQSMVGAASFGR